MAEENDNTKLAGKTGKELEKSILQKALKKPLKKGKINN